MRVSAAVRTGVGLVLVIGLGALTLYYYRSSGAVPPARGTVIPASGQKTRPVMLYYGDPNASRLVAEGREVLFGSDRVATLKSLVNELLRGSQRGNRSLFSADCRVRSIFLTAGGTLTIDFRGSPFPAEASETACKLGVDSMLRVQRELFPEIQRVMLLVDGRPISEVERRLSLPLELTPSEWPDAGIDVTGTS